jgi:hypothetical protein
MCRGGGGDDDATTSATLGGRERRGFERSQKTL